ncbi:MAG: molybdopterin-dependent oxidoreductase [Chloroflexi bacterium]|nr:molybdopterin-dependent oxidoreductase [Chloroflexota bacterium]
MAEQAIERGMIQTRPCPKGYVQAGILRDPRRVIYPMKRAGRRGEGKFERISWDEALDTIARKLVEVKEKYGPLSILHQPSTGLSECSFPVAPWFGAGFAAWALHSMNGWEDPERWVLGKDYPELVQDEGNILKSRLIVLWGYNPATTLSGGMMYGLLRARERGIPIISVESRYSPSVEVLADQWIPVRPTTDVAMMIAMANVWFKEDLWDREFVDRWVEPEGLRRWKAYVLGADDGVDRTPQWAETICGVPAETIEGFARLYARSRPVNLNVSASIGRQFYGENPTRAAMYLQALTGNTLAPGGTAAAETGVAQGHPGLPKPVVDWRRKPGIYKPPVVMCSYKWPTAIDLREKLDRGEITRGQYNNAIGNVAGNDPPNIQMVFLQSANPLNSLSDINRNIRAMKKVDFVVVSSWYAETPAARYADILLPQIASAFEGRDTKFFVRRHDLFLMGKNLANYFVYCQKCVDPPGEVKDGEWIWVQLARRLDIADKYNPRLANVPDDRWDEVVEDLHREAYEKWRVREEIAPLNPPGWEDFQKKPVFRWETRDPYHAFKKDLESGKNPFRGTPSGRMEFYSTTLARGPDYLAAHEFSPGSGRCYGGGNLPPMAEMTPGGKDTFYSQDTARYPLLMSTPHSLYRVHSLLDNQPRLNGDCYRHAAWISVSDAGARGIADGDRVRVYNDIGEMVIPANVTSRVVPGTVCVFHGGWYVPGEARTPLMPEGIDTRGSPNLLTHNEDLPDTIIGFLPCKGLVQIEKWAA